MVGKGAKERESGRRREKVEAWDERKGERVKRVQWIRLTVDGGGGSSADLKSAPGQESDFSQRTPTS